MIMVSERILRSHSFFNLLSKQQFAALAEIANLEKFGEGDVIFEETMPAETLYFLHDGGVELYCTVFHSYHQENRKESKVGEIAPGQPFGISALIHPYVLTSTARSTTQSEVIRFHGISLYRLLEEDVDLANLIYDQLTKAAMKRLHTTRVNLLNAYALQNSQQAQAG
jgi:CRP-like cAMP-binding protein